METDLFERLLYEEESPTLDFKKEQYPFSRSSEDQKSELLKDILGFCNAWRRADAYILLGVEEVRGGRSHVIGIPPPDHLEDHALQQFVNNLTNQPVHFHYEAFGYEGKQVGVIRIEEQARPIYLKRDYGRLLRETVYVRRGSSTDPTKPASLEEISRMGVGSKEPACDLLVEFADIERDAPRGTSLSLDAEYCKVPPHNEIPDLEEERRPSGLYGSIAVLNPMNRVNSNYFRERAEYEFARRLMRPVRLLLSNIGQVAARNVQIDMSIPKASQALVLDWSSHPEEPKSRLDPFYIPGVHSLLDAHKREPGAVTISENKERYHVEIDCDDLQPGRQVWSERFYIAMRESGNYMLQGRIFADNLSKPKDFRLRVQAAVRATVMTIDELCGL